MSETERNRSIHPRVVKGRTVHPKANTALPKKRRTIERTIRAVERHLEVHPHDEMSRAHLSKLQAQLPQSVTERDEQAEAA